MRKNNPPSSRKSRGMTLLEVLVALAIFATAAISVIRAVTQHINTLGYLEEKTFAAMVVDNQMAMVMLHPDRLKKTKGEQEFAGRTWYWAVTPVETADDVLKAFEVSVATSETSSPVVTVQSYVSR